MARLVHILSPLWLLACAPQDIEPLSGKARFSDFPRTLFAAVESACQDPAETLVRPSRNAVECRTLMRPEATAAVILRYDGTPEKLPQLVVRFDAEPSPPGYLVGFTTFLRVPQKTGPALRVRHESTRVTRQMNALFRRAGGVPE